MSIMEDFFPGLKNQIFTTFLCLKHKINERWDIWKQKRFKSYQTNVSMISLYRRKNYVKLVSPQILQLLNLEPRTQEAGNGTCIYV